MGWPSQELILFASGILVGMVFFAVLLGQSRRSNADGQFEDDEEPTHALAGGYFDFDQEDGDAFAEAVFEGCADMEQYAEIVGYAFDGGWLVLKLRNPDAAYVNEIKSIFDDAIEAELRERDDDKSWESEIIIERAGESRFI